MSLTTNNRAVPVVSLLAACGVCASALATPTSVTPIANRAMLNTAPAEAVDVGASFSDPGTSVLRFHFTKGAGALPGQDLGSVDVALLNARRPITTTNFMNYVNRPASANNSIQNTVMHRLVPGFVLQGGGFKLPTTNNAAGAAVVTDPQIMNEYNGAEVPLLSNIRGTLAMAKLGTGPNTATCQYFFSLADNSTNLNNQNGGFTVFARVIGNGMTVIDQLAAIPIWNLAAGTFNSVPCPDLTASSPDLTPSNWLNCLSITPVTGVQVLTFSAVSGDATVLTTSVSGATVTLTPVANKAATVPVTVTATSPDLTTTTSTFYVRVKGICGAADVASLGGGLGPDNHVTADDLIAFLNGFFASSIAVADIASLGGAPAPDGQLSADDLIAFLDAFFAANCP
ncbi:MAG: peptidylprolyl isomerase [Phycisphaerales bacterium]